MKLKYENLRLDSIEIYISQRKVSYIFKNVLASHICGFNMSFKIEGVGL